MAAYRYRTPMHGIVSQAMHETAEHICIVALNNYH